MIFRKIRMVPILFGLLFTLPAAFAQRIEPRIAGLEGNEEYMSLLRRDAQLQAREDSLATAVEKARRQLREDPANRQIHSDGILQLEEAIFELRNAKGRLIDRINAIEQEWVLANLDGAASDRPDPDAGRTGAPARDVRKLRYLIDNAYFRDNLPKEDYAALRRAQEMESDAMRYAGCYLSNYETLVQLAGAYAEVPTEAEALEIGDRFAVLERTNRELADSLAAAWNYIYDNKSYSYAYVLDKLGQDDILTQEESLAAGASQQLAALQGRIVSEAVADYFLRRSVVLDFEIRTAGVLELDAARDSLRGVAAQAEGVDYRLPKVAIEPRTFIRYDSVAFSKTPKYTYQNPIPECTVYARGTIYRILLGTFNTKRAAATFRGAYPLFYLIDEEGKWRYFTGGFVTHEEAVEVQKALKKHGFVRPEVVVWNDGVYRNLSVDPVQEAGGVFSVEITGTENLSEPVKRTIASMAGSREVSRAGQQLFVVGTFSDREEALRLAEALRQEDAALEIKVTEIAE